MNRKNFGKGIGGALLSLAFVLGMVIATGATAQAQYRNDDGYYGRRDQKEERKAQKREMKRRRKQARRDARYEDRNRNNGIYNDGVYNDGRYGRSDGRYGRNGGYGNTGGYNRVELDRGYQQGLQTGASDGQRNQSYDPQRSRHIKNASSKDFREGFVRVYDQGYRQYAGSGNQGSSNGWLRSNSLRRPCAAPLRVAASIIMAPSAVTPLVIPA